MGLRRTLMVRLTMLALIVMMAHRKMATYQRV